MSQPHQYIQGWSEFYKLRFMVNASVLIPRPETELLVEQVILAKPTSVIEVGTGSGCISISIAKNVPDCQIRAVDISREALLVAEKNAKINYVQNQITFIKSDLLSAISQENAPKVDWIVANLPYIPTNRIPTLDSSVKDFEPHLALDGGEDGFELYRRLFTEMNQKGIIPRFFIGEIDIDHKDLARNEAEKYFPQAIIEIKKDLTKRTRFLVITF